MNRILVCCLVLAGCPESTAPSDASTVDGASFDGAVDSAGRETGPVARDGGPSGADARGRDARVDDDAGVRVDANTPDVFDAGPPLQPSAVDLLFVVDNSGSMAQEQASLAAEVPVLIDSLITGRTGSGRVFTPVDDLRVGVVSSDMGTGGSTIPTCNEPNFGDDGILTRQACETIPGGEPPYLALRPGGPGPVSFARDIACLVSLGTQGCGFEQQLDAMLKAVTPGDSAIRFVNGSTGQADRANEDFVRDNSILVVVVLTDEDDCSAADPDLFNRDSLNYPDPDLNLRCARYPNATHPTDRFVEGLLALKPPRQIIYHLIAGIPVDLVAAVGDPTDYSSLIGDPAERDPRMVERVDPAMPSQLTPSCSVVGRGEAYPPVRLVQVARGLDAAGANANVQSICQEDFTSALTEQLADSLP